MMISVNQIMKWKSQWCQNFDTIQRTFIKLLLFSLLLHNKLYIIKIKNTFVFTNNRYTLSISLCNSFSTTLLDSSNFIIQRSIQLFTVTWFSRRTLCARHFLIQLSVILLIKQITIIDYRL